MRLAVVQACNGMKGGQPRGSRTRFSASAPQMEQVRESMIAYSGAIKNVDPGALVVGPEEWAWSGYVFSGYDQQYGSRNGWSFLPDRAAHGGMDYLPWLLQQLKTRSDLDGRRVIDVFTVHYYPQGGEFWPDGDVSTAMQLRHNRSTALALGSGLHRRDMDQRQGPADSADAQLGEHQLLPGHADRHYRVQLGTETADTWVYRVQAYNSVEAFAYANSATIRVR
ncbi:hypothetical protein BH18ACI5_BH18ACI5_18340 [soil metagenome]